LGAGHSDALLVGLTAATSQLLASSLTAQFATLSEKLPESLDRFREYLSQYPWGRAVVERVPQATESSLAQMGDLSHLTGMASGVSNALIAVVVILFVGIFVAAEPGLYADGMLHLVPPPQRPRAAEVLDSVGHNLRWWLVGQAVLMLMMAVTTAAGLWMIGIPLPLALGLIAGIFELVPYIGPWLSAVPAALIAMLISPWHLAMVLVLYLALHILEGYILVPLIQRRSVRLPPAVTLVTQLLFAELLGILGLFVAAPLTVVAVVSLRMLYVEDVLGDESEPAPGEPASGVTPAPSPNGIAAAPDLH
jgi:predicted PurR-regulated permease PerM